MSELQFKKAAHFVAKSPAKEVRVLHAHAHVYMANSLGDDYNVHSSDDLIDVARD